MEKKKRSKCETSHRKVFTVNEMNPKEKVIFDFLELQYNEAETTKDILYDYIISNNLQTTQHSARIVHDLGKNSVNNNAERCKTSVKNSADDYKESVSNNTTYNNEEKNIVNDNFNINLDSIKDEEVEIKYNNEEEVEKADNNALNFLKGQFA